MQNSYMWAKSKENSWNSSKGTQMTSKTELNRFPDLHTVLYQTTQSLNWVHSSNTQIRSKMDTKICIHLNSLSLLDTLFPSDSMCSKQNLMQPERSWIMHPKHRYQTQRLPKTVSRNSHARG